MVGDLLYFSLKSYSKQSHHENKSGVVFVWFCLFVGWLVWFLVWFGFLENIELVRKTGFQEMLSKFFISCTVMSQRYHLQGIQGWKVNEVTYKLEMSTRYQETAKQ